MNQLKSALLSLGVVEDNTYLDQYVDLIQSNFSNTFEKFRSQRHHVVPRCCSHLHKTKILFEPEVVVLLHKDHALAHYYLARCAKEEWFRIANIDAFKIVLNHFLYKKEDYYEEEKQLFSSLEDYQHMIEDTNRAKSQKMKGVSRGPMSEDHKQKLREANTGRSQSAETKKKRADSLRGKHRTADTRAKISASRKGMKFSDEHKRHISESRKNMGFTHTAEHREHMSTIMKGVHAGKIYINNGVVSRLIYPHEYAEYDSTIWKRGSVPGRIWVYRGTERKMVLPAQLQEHIDQGFQIGMNKNGVENN